MNLFRSRQSCWIVTLSLTAIAVVYLTFVWAPGRRRIKEIQEQVETKRNFVTQSANVSKMLLDVEERSKRAKALAGKWEQNASRKKDVSSLFGKINAVAKEAQLSVLKFDPQPVISHEKINEIPIAMSCSGSFTNIYDFFGGIERLPETVWVESMRIDKIASGTKDVRCEVNLVVFSK